MMMSYDFFLHAVPMAVGLLAAVMVVAPSKAGAETMDLSGEWKVRLDPRDAGTSAGWARADFDDSDWETTGVPGKLPEKYDGVAWFRKSVKVDGALAKAAEEGRVKLIFRQVDDHATVYVNGQIAAQHTQWNTPFFADLSRFLTNVDTNLVIAVRVKDLGGPGGILRPVEIAEVSNPADLYKTEEYDKKPHSTLAQNGNLVMYSVYVRNFSKEGTFNALRKRLPELKGLGVNILWLLPIHEIGATARKGPDGSPYAIKDYYSVDPSLGTKEDFRALVKAAHEQGMKVIIDCVMNHTSPDSLLAKEHPNWFIRDAKGKPVPRNLDWHDIVDLDWDNKEVWEYTSKMLESWVRDYDIDGYRCDVADLMPDGFWQQLRPRLDRIKPGGIFMLAESSAPRQHLNGFDLTYSFGLWDAAIPVIKGGQSVELLRAAILNGEFGYPRGATQMLFVENHDKERAPKVFGGIDQAKLFAVMTATLPGVPLLYTGTEVGANVSRDDTFFKRVPVDFSRDPNGMRRFWTDLLALRAKHKALQTGSLKLLESYPADTSLAYERHSGKDKVLVVLNVRPSPAEIRVKSSLAPGGKVKLPAWGWRVFAE
ncbi:MAG: hypothetical protein K1X53_06915 [Candidatus Sumerlaeaceae bacterium]|nr:hypothetical protein [Candidatus Sumerlaeaceae bacterium]